MLLQNTCLHPSIHPFNIRWIAAIVWEGAFKRDLTPTDLLPFSSGKPEPH